MLVIDYTQKDFTQNEKKYDLIFDIVANRSISSYMRILKPKGRYVACAFNPSSLFLGSIISIKEKKTVCSLAAKPNVEDLEFISDLIETSKIHPIIDRCYPLSEVALAIQYYGERHSQGKIVISVNQK